MISAPWTDQQVKRLNGWQDDDRCHPFTCPNHHDQGSRILQATPEGWKCPSCLYTQSWAHDFMLRED